ncbi:hypothetical protein [Klebsiella michiganensis]|uniref:Uncharacterized protein n=1 Tax=Klebsiella michiganensis (strain ATCC 8724 / DSM 4798 / JCM 20051 / NBRC 3318 / NRRL B-199 / KCTC 1686 / BUCSAV 143 / CCM 1901) TaxID=1006551 RepID=A0A0H3H0A4_KLEM8|nr:hypothetical protein [Klebsiella michiganensis]AEX01792.1 hypothetical protein KOX_00225 [Klebsiella michiganensis KCTC 1686]
MLNKQHAEREEQQKTALDALTKKNAELNAAAATAQKEYDVSVAALNDKNKNYSLRSIAWPSSKVI